MQKKREEFIGVTPQEAKVHGVTFCGGLAIAIAGFVLYMWLKGMVVFI